MYREKKIVDIFWGTINLVMICSYLIVLFVFLFLYWNHCIFLFVKKVDLFFVSRVCLVWVWVKIQVQEHSKCMKPHYATGVSVTIATSIGPHSLCSIMWLLRRLNKREQIAELHWWKHFHWVITVRGQLHVRDINSGCCKKWELNNCHSTCSLTGKWALEMSSNLLPQLVSCNRVPVIKLYIQLTKELTAPHFPGHIWSGSSMYLVVVILRTVK